MIESALLSESLAVVAALDPLSSNNGARSTGWVDMAEYSHLLVCCQVGATDATVDFAIQQAADSSGTSTTTLKAATQVSAVGDNRQVLINVRNKELTQGKRFVRLTATVSNATGALVSAIVLGGGKRYGEPRRSDITSVGQVLN